MSCDCQVTTCCGCVELRTGCLAIGYLSLFWNTIIGIIYLIALIGAASLGIPVVAVIIGIDFAIVMLDLIFTICLLIGVHQYKPKAVKAYLIFGVVFAILSLILFIMNIVFGSILNIIINLITLVLTIYFLIVIRSFYLRMDIPVTSRT